MPESEDPIQDAIEENAVGPKSASGDTGSVTQHPLPDQIEADKYTKAKNATRAGNGLGIRYVKFVPPGTV